MKRTTRKLRSANVPETSSVTSLPMRGHRVGQIGGIEADSWVVECPLGSPPQPARTTLGLSAQAMRDAAAKQRRVLVVFENEAADKPIVVGLLDDAPSPAVEVSVDGKRVTIDAQDEIVLRCGQASITLRRNGRVVIRGTYVETRAQGVNRVKGGTVLIN